MPTAQLPPTRRPKALSTARARAAALSTRGQEWVDDRTPASLSWVAVNGWRRYRSVEGPLQSALLSLYILVAVLPALLVLEEYLDPKPAALADSLVHHYSLA